MKTLKFAKSKKWNKTKAKKHLDKLFSLMVREEGRCVLRGHDKIQCGGVLQCAHIIGRANLFLRWDIRNALCICAGHHVFYTYHPEEWRGLMERYHEDNYDWLLDNREQKITFNETYYKSILTLLEDNE